MLRRNAVNLPDPCFTEWLKSGAPLAARSLGQWSFVPAQLPTPNFSFQRTLFYLEYARYVIFVKALGLAVVNHTAQEARDSLMFPLLAVGPRLGSPCMLLRRHSHRRRKKRWCFTYSVNFYIKHVRANKSRDCQL